MLAISAPAYHDDGGLAHSKQVGGRILHMDAYRVPGGQTHPIQSSLYIRQTRPQATDHVRIRCDSEADAVHDARKAHVGF
jgi:hypothetical protein